MTRTKDTVCVSPLADALQMRLGLHRLPGKEPKVVQLGKLKRKYSPFFGMSVDIEPHVKASYVGEKSAAVLVRIKGDLYLYMVYHQPSDEIVVAMVDAGKHPFTPLQLFDVDGAHPKKVIASFDGAVRAVYRRKQSETKWREDTDGPKARNEVWLSNGNSSGW